MIRRSLLSGLVVALFATFASAADFPQRNIQLIVPFEPGGAGDITSRIIAEAANEILDRRKITVINRSGGGGIVGQTFVSRARPDGHTILSMTNSVVTNPTLKGASYSVSDFEPVGMYNFDPEVIAVSADSPFQSLDDFVAAARTRKLNIVTAGVATAHHMAGLAIEEKTDLVFNYLPVRGFGQQLQSIMGNHADAGLWPLGEALTHVEAGSVRILAIADETRDARLPEVPTFLEGGLGVAVWATFRGWAVPAGTPDDVVQTLSELLETVHASDAYRQKMTAAGYRPVYRDAADYRKAIKDYLALTEAVIAAHGLAD